MFGTKKLGEKLAAHFEGRAKAYEAATKQPGVDPRTAERCAVAAMVLGEVASGIRFVTGAATKEELAAADAEG